MVTLAELPLVLIALISQCPCNVTVKLEGLGNQGIVTFPMVSDLGQGAALYAARTARSRRPARLNNSLSGLAQVGEGSLSDEVAAPSDSPKRWIRDIPGSVNQMGEVVRSGSPLRLSSTRTFFRPGDHRRNGSIKKALHYGVMLLPCFIVLPMMLSYMRSSKTTVNAPVLPTSISDSADINPTLLQFLKENNEHVAQLSSKVSELEHILNEKEQNIQELKSQNSNQVSAQASLMSEIKNVVFQSKQVGGVSRSELDKVLLELEHSKAELTLSILEQKSQLQEVVSKKNNNSGSMENIEKLINRAFYRHLADDTEMVDYALESTGGSVLSVSGTHTGSVGLFSLATNYFLLSRKCEEIIRPEVTPGQCWPMAGQSGWAIISLSDSIFPKAVTLEHVAPEIAPHFESAPKEFSLAAINGTGETAGSVSLGTWKYRKPVPGEIPIVQSFSISKVLEHPISTVNFTINSNYEGNYTCIYRVRIHGERQAGNYN